MTPSAPKEVTGRMVLLCLIGFFFVVVGINAVMVRVAVSTFGGVETDSSYKAGLAFAKEAQAAHRAGCPQLECAGERHSADRPAAD
jgi:nitrogen fixation protein FixH